MEMLGPLCNQTVNLETDAKTLYYSLLKKKTHTNRIFYPKKSSNRWIILCVPQDTYHELFCVFGDLYVHQDAGHRAVADPDLQIRGGPALQKEFFRLFGQIILVKK